MATENQMDTFEAVMKWLKAEGYEVRSIEFDTQSDTVTINLVTTSSG